MAGIDYFDWWDIFVNRVVGSPILFTVIMIVFISIIAARFRFPNVIYFMIVSIFIIILSVEIASLLPFVIYLIMVFAGVQMSRMVSRG